MKPERVLGTRCRPPFPVYKNLVEDLLSAHGSPVAERDSTVAHALGVCSGFAYSDADTVATTMARLGLGANACVHLTQTVDAMFIYSTAFLVQSRCGRVAILCYRGTEPATLGNWLGDADVGSETISLGTDPAETLRVHAGFHRNVRATRSAVIDELQLALQGCSLCNPGDKVEYPLEALYVTGHSLGGAMAVLFALTLSDHGLERAIADKVRAVYTFGQPLVVGAPLPQCAHKVERQLFRHVMTRDPVPALPPIAWGPLAHFGHEYRFANGVWQRADVAITQLASLKEISRSVLAVFAAQNRRLNYRYTFAEHGPHHYIAALRPKGRVTEFGDDVSTSA